MVYLSQVRWMVGHLLDPHEISLMNCFIGNIKGALFGFDDFKRDFIGMQKILLSEEKFRLRSLALLWGRQLGHVYVTLIQPELPGYYDF